MRMNICKIVGFVFIICLMSCNQNQNGASKEKQINLKQDMEITKAQGVITKISSKSFEDTYNTLVEIITNNPNLKIIAQLDHQVNAGKVDLKLNPTRIILFGNPKLGTPLMQNAQIIGLDLPQKILVWQNDEGVVHVSYNDPEFLKVRYDITGNKEVLATVAKALNTITDKTIGL